MDNQMKIFENEMFCSLRTIEKDNNVWFVGKDVAEILGYADTSRAVFDHVDKEDKTSLVIQQSGSNYKANTTIINESGLYCLVLSSKLPIAKAFRRWITSEVIPSIRKHHAYMTDDTLEKALTSPDFLIKLAYQLKSEQEKRIKAEEDLKIAEPKVKFADTVQDTDKTIYVRDMAKILIQHGINTGANRLMARQDGYLTKQKGSFNYPSQSAITRGLMTVVEKPYTTRDGCKFLSIVPKITPKGQIHFLKKYSS